MGDAAKKSSDAAPPPDARTLRNFGLLVGGLLIGLFVVWPLLRHRPPHLWPWFVGGPLVLVGLAVPRALALPYRGWMRLGHALGWINLRIILTVVFAVLFVPIGLLRRLGGSDSMGRKPRTDTYRRPSQALPRDRMERPF